MTSAQTSDDVGCTIEPTSSLHSKIASVWIDRFSASVMIDDVGFAADVISVPGLRMPEPLTTQQSFFYLALGFWPNDMSTINYPYWLTELTLLRPRLTEVPWYVHVFSYSHNGIGQYINVVIPFPWSRGPPLWLVCHMFPECTNFRKTASIIYGIAPIGISTVKVNALWTQTSTIMGAGTHMATEIWVNIGSDATKLIMTTDEYLDPWHAFGNYIFKWLSHLPGPISWSIACHKQSVHSVNDCITVPLW